MNWKLISKIIGVLLFIQTGLLLLCMGVGIIYHEAQWPFAYTAAIAFLLGMFMQLLGRGASTNMGRKDGYLVVTIAWVVYSLIGMLPYLFENVTSGVASAFFETMSGYTTTGATIFDDIDALPNSLLFHRSLSQWVGGVGIIFFTIALLPAFGVGEVRLFAAESTGLFHDKVHPRISVTARWIGFVYCGITLLSGVSYWLCGMSIFDAVNYALTTTATGGFGTHTALMEEVYHSPLIEYVMAFFMMLSGINYTLIYTSLLKGRIKRLWSDAELRCYLRILTTITLACTLVLFLQHLRLSGNAAAPWWQSLENAFRQAFFTTTALQTTTGYATVDYTLWPIMLMPLLLFIMFAGACSGSSSSGFKCIRWSIIYRVVANEVKHILHPRAVLPVRINHTVIPTQLIITTFAFAALFAAAVFGGAFILTITGIQPDAAGPIFDYRDAITIALSQVANIGPSMGYFGPLHSYEVLTPASKIVCSVLMLLGRLEIFPILLICSRNFWKRS